MNDFRSETKNPFSAPLTGIFALAALWLARKPVGLLLKLTAKLVLSLIRPTIFVFGVIKAWDLIQSACVSDSLKSRAIEDELPPLPLILPPAQPVRDTEVVV